MGQSETFSIRQMVELTGLSEFTVRGWESRYGAFRPQRSKTGRREYRRVDIERALLLRELLKRGHKIGKVAGLGTKKLQKLFTESDAELSREARSELTTQFAELMALQKWSELRALIAKVPIQNTGHLVIEFFLPIMKQMAIGVNNGVISISQEHVGSSLLKEKIYSALVDLEAKQSLAKSRMTSRFVLAAPEGDYHDIGLLLAHLLIRSHGFISLNLGPHTPARDLSETALRFNASHVLLVTTVSKKGGAAQEPLSFIRDVQRQVGSHLKVIVAGPQAPVVSLDPRSSLCGVGSFHELDSFLQKIES